MNRTARPPKTLAQAQQLLEHFAELDAALAYVENNRSTAIAAANAAADAEAGPLIEELQALKQQLQPWWDQAKADLAKGKKSIQLSGCNLGYAKARAKLAHGFEKDDDAVEALRPGRFFRQTTKTRYQLDRTATMKLLELGGAAAASLTLLGFRIDGGEDSFFVKRVEQDATISA